MKYQVTRDLHDRYRKCIAFWPEDATVEMDDSGFWGSTDGKHMADEMSVGDFKEKYNLEIERGEKRLVEIVVHWLD
jgi:hypothetical protein